MKAIIVLQKELEASITAKVQAELAVEDLKRETENLKAAVKSNAEAIKDKQGEADRHATAIQDKRAELDKTIADQLAANELSEKTAKEASLRAAKALDAESKRIKDALAKK